MCETAVPKDSPTPSPTGPADLRRAHFVGIAGMGMLPLARLCLERGHIVSGSDARHTEALEVLASMGATVHRRHAAGHVPADATAVVFTSAIGRENPEIAQARRLGIPLVHRSQALNELMVGRTAVGVTGTHGKTSTTGMIATALSRMGHDPSYALGGDLNGPASGSRLGAGAVMVAEVDESDRSLLAVSVNVAVITDLEHDHPETYADVAEHVNAYAAFVAGMRRDGTVVLNADRPASRDLARRLATDCRGLRLITFGQADDADYRISNPSSGPEGARATLTVPGGRELPLRLTVPGVHQLRNAAAAVAAACATGVDAAVMVRALAGFAGVERRFSALGTAAGVQVYASYAHHPTAVAADLAGARSVAGAGRALAVFQPASQARLAVFCEGFGTALAGADQVVITGNVPALHPAVLQDLAAAVRRAGGEPAGLEVERSAAAQSVAAAARPGDVIVLIGTGDLAEEGRSVVDRLARTAGCGVSAA
ncbi:UDP-N-acetylmuramate--L-alanine ligase [Streptomyces sp. NPDC002055]|uniref:UDP-N-acetylmuramate--L-alanine ligase n=1 Tax=Streptomyces sp. NPDC002055 TaxID=3154534 RepID=UPI00331F0F26